MILRRRMRAAHARGFTDGSSGDMPSTSGPRMTPEYEHWAYRAGFEEGRRRHVQRVDRLRAEVCGEPPPVVFDPEWVDWP